VKRFWRLVNKLTGDNGCWEWTGYSREGRCGQFRHNGKSKLAHRFAWELANGEIPEGMCVYRSCDNRICVNPAHLFLAEKNKQKSTEERFWNKVKKSDNEDGCWEWTGCQGGIPSYGYFGMNGKSMRAHRAVWELTYGPMSIPSGLCVLHHCDNRLCVNPKHLFLGTHKMNTQDCIKKGRWGNPAAKLTLDEIVKIRQEYKAGGVIQRELAEKFGVSRSQIGNIVAGKFCRGID
jgi:hypothetical protein